MLFKNRILLLKYDVILKNAMKEKMRGLKNKNVIIELSILKAKKRL